MATRPKPLYLSPRDVHVWFVALDHPDWPIDRLTPVLSTDEVTRADRFHFDRDRHQFVVARGLLRILLGRYFGLAPKHIPLQYETNGKPFVTLPYEQDALQFNLSHSRNLAAYAVGRNRRIGIDVEWVRPIPDAEQITRRFFSPWENNIWSRLPEHQKEEAFFACWTRKEAYVKARSEGLSMPLDQFDVTLEPDTPAQLLSTRPDTREAARWSLHALNPLPGYVGALAVEGQDCLLTCRFF